MAKTSYICKITAEQAELLGRILAEQNWELDSMPYAHWRARRDKTTVVAYESGKLVTQGKGMAKRGSATKRNWPAKKTPRSTRRTPASTKAARATFSGRW